MSDEPLTPHELPVPDDSAATGAAASAATTCPRCGANVFADQSFCEACGAEMWVGTPATRDRYTESPAGWVAACCDLGRRHHRNEDATAVAAARTPGSRAVGRGAGA